MVVILFTPQIYHFHFLEETDVILFVQLTEKQKHAALAGDDVRVKNKCSINLTRHRLCFDCIQLYFNAHLKVHQIKHLCTSEGGKCQQHKRGLCDFGEVPARPRVSQLCTCTTIESRVLNRRPSRFKRAAPMNTLMHAACLCEAVAERSLFFLSLLT